MKLIGTFRGKLQFRDDNILFQVVFLVISFIFDSSGRFTNFCWWLIKFTLEFLLLTLLKKIHEFDEKVLDCDWEILTEETEILIVSWGFLGKIWSDEELFVEFLKYFVLEGLKWAKGWNLGFLISSKEIMQYFLVFKDIVVMLSNKGL